MLYVVGLGLGDEKDITVNGLEAVKRCERVYLEAYTSVLGVPKERLEALYGREVVVADREFVEQGIDGMLNEALKKLRKVVAKERPQEYNKVKVLWRGMKDMTLDFEEFRANGGTELAPMSTSPGRRAPSRSPSSTRRGD